MSLAKRLESLQVLDGKYALFREIGSGASGTVYEAEHLLVGELVAIKLLQREAFANLEHREQFLTEARAVTRLAHANVVDFDDLGVTPDGVPYLAMELLRGETLEAIIATRGALPAHYACELVLQVLAALSAAHAQGLLHGDLKPASVMVTHPRSDRPLVKLLDFGITRRLFELGAGATKGLGGSPRFMSPEQARGDAIDARSDVYSASALLYTMLAGRDPFASRAASAVVERVVAGDFVPLCQANPQVPKLLAAIVERGLALEPRRRIESADEYAELLRPFMGADSPALPLGSRRRLSSAPSPFVATLREIEIQRTLPPERPSRASSVIPVRIASYSRGVTDSLLLAPRFPRSANSPRMQLGRDFLPRQGEPGWGEVEERRLSTQAPHPPQPRRAGRGPWLALLATGVGFGVGVLIAWLSGAI